MAKVIRKVDDQGRVNIPPHMRQALNLAHGTPVAVLLEEGSQTLKITPTQERCSLCGEGIQDGRYKPVTIGPFKHKICFDCAGAVARAMLKD